MTRKPRFLPWMLAVVAGGVSLVAPALAATSPQWGAADGDNPWLGEPASTIKIVDSTALNTPGDASWFLRGDLGIDVPVKGAAGFGLSVGHFWKYVFIDGGFTLYQARYGALRVYQTGSGSSTPLDPSSELARSRADADTATMLSIGPGIGYSMKLFGSEKWVDSGRFGLNYLQYQDSTNNVSFRGALANFHFELGYRVLDSLTLAPGMTYNLGYTAKSSAPQPVNQRQGFLPIQWWSWQLGVYIWL